MKIKNKYFVPLVIVLTLALVAATFYPEPWGTDVDAGNYSLNNVNLNWSSLKNYPSACPGASAITTLGDSVTCTDSWINAAGDNMTGPLHMTGQNITNVSYINPDGEQVIFGGNVTAENVYLPTYISTHTNASINAVEGVWINITFDKHADTIKSKIDHTYNDATNDTFTILSNGVYRIDYGISYLDSQANPNNIIAIRIINNNAEIDGSVFEKDTTKQNAVGTIYRSVATSLTAGDKVKLQFISNSTTVALETPGTYGGHPTSANINIHKIA